MKYDGLIICQRRPRRAKARQCQGKDACTRTAMFQCDFATSATKTCDRWLCPKCRKPQGPNRDYCPDHARQLALPGLRLEPGVNFETVRNTAAPAPAASSSPAAAAAVAKDGKLAGK